MDFDFSKFDWSAQRKNRRRQRLGSTIRADAANWLQENAYEKGVVVSVTRVEVHEDLYHADIYVLVYPLAKEQETMQKLEDVKKELRRFLAQRLNMRAVPEIGFLKDTQELVSERIEGLLDDIKKE